MTTTPRLFLGAARGLDATATSVHLHVPAHHLVTHGVVVGITGSGKTGLVTVMVEEALRGSNIGARAACPSGSSSCQCQ